MQQCIKYPRLGEVSVCEAVNELSELQSEQDVPHFC